MRHTSSHTKNRRSHHALAERNLVEDTKNDSLHLPHRLDETTGLYRGKQIISKVELKRRETRAKARGERAKVEEDTAPVAPGMAEPVNLQGEEQPKQPKAGKGLLGRFTKGRAQARSGTGT